MSVHWNISVTTILFSATVVLLLVFVVSPCNSPGIEGGSSLHSAIKWLATHSYTEADPINKPTPSLPEPVQESAVSTTHGTGIWIPTETYTPADTLEVELSVVELEDGSAFVKVTIDSVEVKWHRLEHYRRDTSSRFTLFGEVTNRNGAIAVGIAYKLFTVASIDVSTAVSVSPQLDRVAGGIQLTRKLLGNISFGVGGGYGLGANDGGYVSGLVSIGL
jgi:hypothetical protein